MSKKFELLMENTQLELELSSERAAHERTRTKLLTTQAALWAEQAAHKKTQEELSSERAARQAAQAELWGTKAALDNAQAELLETKDELDNTQAELSRTKDALTAAQVELSRTNDALSTTQAALWAEQAAHKKTQAELARTNDALTAAQAELSAEQAAHGKTQEALYWAKDALSTLEDEFFQTKDALTAARADLSRERAAFAATQEALSDKTAEAEHLNQELENSVVLLELKTLDCEQARQTLAFLRERNLSDEDTLELMRAEPFLKGNSVRKTLETVERELDAAENALGRIIRLREKINDAVQTAILVGNGALPLSEELGGNGNGADRPTSEQGPEDGAGLERGHERTGAAAAGD